MNFGAKNSYNTEIERFKYTSAPQDQFGKCKVCYEKATGIHYGVISCEGCKGFFKRSLTHSSDYVCFNSQDCDIANDKRNNCRLCRYNKCLRLGMSINAIKLGRMSFSRKKKLLELKNTEETHLNNHNNNHNHRYVSNENSILNLSLNMNKLTIYDESKEKNISLILDQTSKNFKQINDFLIYQDQSDLFDLFSINLNQYKQFDLNKFLNVEYQLFKSSEIIPKTFFTNMYINSHDENILILLTLIKDKSYQLFREYTKLMNYQLERAKYLVKHKITLFDGYNATKEQAWDAVLKYHSEHLHDYMVYTKELPGFNKICPEDLIAIHRENITLIGMLRCQMLVFNNESYFVSNNIQICKRWVRELFGEKPCHHIFNFHRTFEELGLTDNEMALVIPFILTSTDETLKNPEFVMMLSQYYSRALMYEFSLNNRDAQFIDKISEALELAKKIRSEQKVKS